MEQISLYIALLAALVAFMSAYYARRSCGESERANRIAEEANTFSVAIFESNTSGVLAEKRAQRLMEQHDIGIVLAESEEAWQRIAVIVGVVWNPINWYKMYCLSDLRERTESCYAELNELHSESASLWRSVVDASDSETLANLRADFHALRARADTNAGKMKELASEAVEFNTKSGT